MKQVRSITICLAAIVGGCASNQDPSTITATPSPSSNAQVAAPPRVTQPEGRQAAMLPNTGGGHSFPTTMTAPGKHSVYFDYDRDDIKPEFHALLEEHAEYLRKHPALRARIEGNADERGSREYNLALGQRRAEAVVRTLRMLGVPDTRLEAVSYGEERPRRTAHEEASWAENRRGDLLLLKGDR